MNTSWPELLCETSGVGPERSRRGSVVRVLVRVLARTTRTAVHRPSHTRTAGNCHYMHVRWYAAASVTQPARR